MWLASQGSKRPKYLYSCMLQTFKSSTCLLGVLHWHTGRCLLDIARPEAIPDFDSRCTRVLITLIVISQCLFQPSRFLALSSIGVKSTKPGGKLPPSAGMVWGMVSTSNSSISCHRSVSWCVFMVWKLWISLKLMHMHDISLGVRVISDRDKKFLHLCTVFLEYISGES